ncbi:hypothetical protein M885DRAFT_591964 [Pelagophyceae sp. CCMP2097]|nr:hypothetical protein M885DRAFT_591964 [Pelagophyceae sp. CCMP2097]
MFSKRVFDARRQKAKDQATAARKKGDGPSFKLWINKLELTLGRLCSFCERRAATLHCVSCTSGHAQGDFLCDECDWEVHRHFKRLDHVRTALPTCTADRACLRVTGLLRCAIARGVLLQKCREAFDRFYDPRSRRYFYCDIRRATAGAPAWHKPYALKDFDLKPFPTFDECARRVQQCVLCKAARNVLVFLTTCYYDRIFSREHARFYYYYNGPSPLLERASWDKPRFLYHRDLKPHKSDDVAALMIQCQWFVWRARRFMRSAIRLCYTCRTDAVTGKQIYTNAQTHRTTLDKPWLLGAEEYDPEDISLWGTRKLCIWFRRLGLKYMVPHLMKFRVDGALLLAFEWDDYLGLGLKEHHRIKRVLLEMEKRSFFSRHKDRPVTLVRRERLRYHHRIEAAAVRLQRFYRRRYRLVVRGRIRAIKRLAVAKARTEARRKDGALWWTAKLKGLPVPDHGRLYGKQRATANLAGFGAWVGDAFHETDAALRPAPRDYGYRPPNNAQVAGRRIRFIARAQDAGLRDVREKMIAKLLDATDDLNAAIAEEGGALKLTNG